MTIPVFAKYNITNVNKSFMLLTEKKIYFASPITNVYKFIN